MQDLTTGSLSRHLLKTSSFMLIAMVFQTLYVLIDLYWVARLGTDAVAAVAVSGNLMFFVLAATQMLGVGTTTLVSHAVGRKEHDTARLVFNQSLGLAATLGVLFFTIALLLRLPYATSLSADADTASLAGAYLTWFIPSLALQFPLVAMGAAMRGTGNFKPGMIVQSATIIINIVLAPILIFGWCSECVSASAARRWQRSLPFVVGNMWMALYFLRHDSYLTFSTAQMPPQRHLWTKMLKVGLPAGAEFAMMTVYLLVIYCGEPSIWRERPGGIRHRDADHSGLLHAGGRARLRRGAGGGTELRGAPRRAGEADVLCGGGHGNGRDDPRVPRVASGRPIDDACLHQRGSGHCRRRGILADRVLELHRVGDHLRGLEHVPGDGQYDSLARQLVHTYRRNRDSGDVSVEDARIRSAVGVAAVRR
jgi:hypothetical protein